jgi:hypothetical protein
MGIASQWKTKTAKDKNYNKVYGVTLLECELIAIPVCILE